MLRPTILICALFVFILSFCQKQSALKITTKITDSAKAKIFDQNYEVVLPIHDYYRLFKFITPDLFDSAVTVGHDLSYVMTNTIFGKNISTIQLKKLDVPQSKRSMLTEVWMQPLNRSTNGYLYLDNNKIVSRKYNGTTSEEITIGKDINADFDRHCLFVQGDSLYYFALENFNKRKKILDKEDTIIDFDFYEWNSHTNKNTYLFSSSTIVPDSMLVPALFESNGIYSNVLDVYHWNWIQKPSPDKLLINFAFSGSYQVDLKTHKIDWYWGNNGHSFSKITGTGKNINPYYTHDFNIITSGRYKGYYSYFENGSNGDSIHPFRPARGRIFKINKSDNSLEIVFDKVYDVAPIAMGSISVIDDYVMVNLGMNVPAAETERIVIKTGSIQAAKDFLKNYKHPLVYIYDLNGNEISSYTYPFGFLSYSAWIKKK